MGKLVSVKAVFKNGVFVPQEACFLSEGSEAVVVFYEEENPKSLALKRLTASLKNRIAPKSVKLVEENGEEQIFVLVDRSERELSEALKAVMEEALKVYEESGVYLPVQLITEARLKKWQEQKNPVYEKIKRGRELLK
jgi:predicted DNA-binding antitoxin AbrB/MazE fold protein